MNKREILKALIAKRIYDLRIENNMTQERCAAFLGIDEKHLGKLERGKKLPSSLTLIETAVRLSIDLNNQRDEYEHLINNDA